jgi:hypothetical protein
LHRSALSIGGVSLQVLGDRRSDVVFDAEHSPFRAEVARNDIEIRIVWAERISQVHGRELFDSGTTWRLHEHEGGFRFDFGNPVSANKPHKRLMVDAHFRHATLQMSEEYFAVYPEVASPLGYPLDELLIMHRLTQERAIELHGTGIVRANGEGNLFVGHSGAGKSTTTRLWTSREEVEVLSDDRIIVRPDDRRNAGSDELETSVHAADAAGEVGILRLRDCSASRSNHFAQGDRMQEEGLVQHDRVKSRGMRMYGTPWHGEAMFASPNSAPLQRIFVLEHGHDNVITRLSRSQAVAELFARSFVPFHRHEYVESALSFLEQLVDSVPCYRYSFEPDHRAVDKILHFHD